MINTGLPYDTSIINDVKNNGALIDMSNINFPNINNDIRVSYIYLRNTDFNVELDFTKCNSEFKKQFVYFYLFGDIVYNIESMNNTWMDIMFSFNGCNDVITGILAEDEIQSFVEKNREKIEIVNKFLFSLLLFPIIRLKDYKFDTSDIETVDGKPFNENVYGIIRNNMFNTFLTLDGTNSPLIFNDYFTEENNELFETIAKYTPYQALLYGLFNSSDDEWKLFVDNIKNATISE